MRYFELMRLHKPIGIWLVFFPAAWGVLLSPERDLGLLPLMLLGAVLIRSAGCIINDLTDQKLDAQVARTKGRPLASGAVRRREALVLLGLLLAMGFALCLTLPRQVLQWSVVAMPFIAAYPWMKRITHWPQAFLGLAFNFGAVIGWAATGAPVSISVILLYAACFFWTLGYDTVYAIQDMADDRAVGIKSTAQAIAPHALPWFVLGCYGGMLVLVLLATSKQAGSVPSAMFLAWWAATALQAIWQVRELRRTQGTDPAHAGRLFRSNQWLGLLLTMGLLTAL